MRRVTPVTTPAPPWVTNSGPSPAAAGAAASARGGHSARVSLAGMPLVRGAGGAGSLDLEEQRVALAAAGADGREAEPAAVAAQLVHHRPQDPPAARADGMAERDGAA